MNNFFNNMVMYIYLFVFCVGVACLTLNFLAAKRGENAQTKKQLWFNLAFLLYMVVNFVLFFDRIFSFGQAISTLLFVAFDVTYVLFLVMWLRYLNGFTVNGRATGSYIGIGICGALYILLWTVLYLSFLGSDGLIFGSVGKTLGLIAEIAIFVSSVECTCLGLYKCLKDKRKQPRWPIISSSVLMLLYFLWFLVYDVDAIFRFIGPSLWVIYPFDWVLFLYFAINIIGIAALYPKMLGKGNTVIGQSENLANGIERIGAKYMLTERELEILADIVSGRSNSEIAKHYVISVNTVKRHINNINRKTEKQKRSELIELAKSYEG